LSLWNNCFLERLWIIWQLLSITSGLKKKVAKVWHQPQRWVRSNCLFPLIFTTFWGLEFIGFFLFCPGSLIRWWQQQPWSGFTKIQNFREPGSLPWRVFSYCDPTFGHAEKPGTKSWPLSSPAARSSQRQACHVVTNHSRTLPTPYSPNEFHTWWCW